MVKGTSCLCLMSMSIKSYLIFGYHQIQGVVDFSDKILTFSRDYTPVRVYYDVDIRNY